MSASAEQVSLQGMCRFWLASSPAPWRAEQVPGRSRAEAATSWAAPSSDTTSAACVLAICG